MIMTLQGVGSPNDSFSRPLVLASQRSTATDVSANPQTQSAAAVTGTAVAEFRLGIEAVERSFGADSPIARKMRSYRSISASIRASTVPADKDSFRADVQRYLLQVYQGDDAFQRAVKDGTLVIQTTDETPELNFQPLIAYTLYRNGEAQDSGTFRPDGFNEDLYRELGQTRNQTRGNYGLRQFYAWWPG